MDIQWSARWLPEYAVRIGVAHEVTELRRAECEIEYRASHDPLTGLSNRHRLQCDVSRCCPAVTMPRPPGLSPTISAPA